MPINASVATTPAHRVVREPADERRADRLLDDVGPDPLAGGRDDRVANCRPPQQSARSERGRGRARERSHLAVELPPGDEVRGGSGDVDK